MKKFLSIVLVVVCCFAYIGRLGLRSLEFNIAYASNIDTENEQTDFTNIAIRDGLYDPEIMEIYTNSHNEEKSLSKK